MHTTPEQLEQMRHSCAHVMAAAIQQLWPEAQFGVGPVIENGFYYDVHLPTSIQEADLEKIATQMRKLKKKKSRFIKKSASITEARAQMQTLAQPFKLDLLDLLETKGSTAISKATSDDKSASIETSADGVEEVTLYQTGDFLDLCRGPHVEHSGQIGHFALHKLSGAYWRGDEKRAQLQRIYGLCFPTEEALHAEIDRLEKLKKRDHRRLAAMLEIYKLDEHVGRGLPMWLPNGMVIRRELE